VLISTGDHEEQLVDSLECLVDQPPKRGVPMLGPGLMACLAYEGG
jgi:hypothetical protein